MPPKRTIVRRSDDIQTAVKSALNDKRMEDMSAQNQDILTKMAEGFARITTRQDIANGKLMAHQARFDKEDGELKGRGKYEAVFWSLFTTLVGLVVAMGMWIVTHH